MSLLGKRTADGILKNGEEKESQKKKPLVRKKALLPNLPNKPAYIQLAELGYTVIPNVLSHQECDEAIAGIQEWFASLGTGVDCKDASTWKRDKLPAATHGIIQQYDVGHIQPIWNVRQSPAVHAVFSELWGTQALMTSFDGMCVQPPYEWLGKKAPKFGRWYHFDQSPKRQGRWCIQGFVTLEEQSAQDATLMVLEKSNLYREKFFEKFNHEDDTDWIKFSEEEDEWLSKQPGVCEVRVVAPKGSLVLWDSQTAHCAGVAQANRPYPRWRYVVYVCQGPVKFATKVQQEKKRKALANKRTTTHWPWDSKLFPQNPRYGNKRDAFVLSPDPPQLTPLGRKLACVEPW